MPKEIERKFLVASDEWRKKAGTGKRMRQAVVVADGDRFVRVRAIDSRKARLTIKIAITGLSRHEFEYDIPIDEAEELLDLAKQGKISKTRYEVKHGRHVWEIDAYDDDLEGLIIAEVEMRTEQDNPELPSWIGREVTGDPRFSNQALARGSLGKDWRNAILD